MPLNSCLGFQRRPAHHPARARSGSVDSSKYAATRPLEWPPNTIGRYRNTDPVLANCLIRLAVEKRNGDYHSFPRRALFDKIGIRTMVLDTDPYGNFLTQGYEQGSGRDWARLANLHLQDGVWNGRRILPEGYVKLVARSRRRGRPISVQSMARCFGSMARPFPHERAIAGFGKVVGHDTDRWGRYTHLYDAAYSLSLVSYWLLTNRIAAAHRALPERRGFASGSSANGRSNQGNRCHRAAARRKDSI
jgi:hypothetical protein